MGGSWGDPLLYQLRGVCTTFSLALWLHHVLSSLSSWGNQPDAVTINFRIDQDQNLVLAEIEGVCDFEERKEFLDRVVADPRYRKGLNIIYDKRRCETVLSAEKNRQLVSYAGRHKDFLEGAKLAVVVPREVFYGMARMQNMLSGGPGLEVMPFHEYQDALDWLED